METLVSFAHGKVIEEDTPIVVYRTLLPWIATLLFCSTVPAAEQALDDLAMPFSDPHQEHEPAVELDASPTLHLYLGKTTLTLGYTPLPELPGIIPSAPITHQGDAGDSAYWLCYTLPTGPTRQRLWIVSHGEMGGNSREITGASAAVLEGGEQESADCPTLGAAYQPLALENGIWLGLSRAELAAKFPNQVLPTSTYFYLFHLELFPECDECQVESILELEFKNDRIHRLWATRVGVS